MRNLRIKGRLLRSVVKTSVKTPIPNRLINIPEIDADGNVIPDYD